MSDRATMPEAAELQKTVFLALREKATLPTSSMFLLGMLAGIYIGIGGLFATVALTGADALPYGVGQVLAGLVFATGLGLVIIAGAELFTGNTMMTGAVLARKITAFQAVKALAVVYAANFVGSLLLAGLVLGAGVHGANDGAFGRAALELGLTKTEGSFMNILASGILANMLVCLAVWSAYAGQTTSQKLAGLTLPVAAFVAAGLEHSVANMYLLPYALMVQGVTEGAAGQLTFAGILGNLVPATIGNIMGGAFVAVAYWTVYGATKHKGG
ncbi:formate/nitrite transporter family protein [Bosea sp. Root381]|uniref:formate/nitrite transporter family protein n=1 Tax=Bosea sp. Root381 TaxID=1736524 RepID=UPI0009E789DA|nr:formate/nitrite transporter family protein [Bosea sp. Root381]